MVGSFRSTSTGATESTADDSIVGVGVDFVGGDAASRTVIFANPRIVQGPLEAD